MGPGWYFCNDCREKFTVRVGTLYEHRRPLLRFHLKCSRGLGRGKLRAERCQTYVGLGYVLNRAGQRRAQAMQDAWCEFLQS